MTDEERYKATLGIVTNDDIPAICFLKAWEAQQKVIDRLRIIIEGKEVRIAELLNEIEADDEK